jgi:hypothetical protein
MKCEMCDVRLTAKDQGRCVCQSCHQDHSMHGAAPALLAACKEFADKVYDPGTRTHCGGVMLDRLARLDAAIAKAEGR